MAMIMARLAMIMAIICNNNGNNNANNKGIIMAIMARIRAIMAMIMAIMAMHIVQCASNKTARYESAKGPRFAYAEGATKKT